MALRERDPNEFVFRNFELEDAPGLDAGKFRRLFLSTVQKLTGQSLRCVSAFRKAHQTRAASLSAEAVMDSSALLQHTPIMAYKHYDAA